MHHTVPGAPQGGGSLPGWLREAVCDVTTTHLSLTVRSLQARELYRQLHDLLHELSVRAYVHSATTHIVVPSVGPYATSHSRGRQT